MNLKELRKEFGLSQKDMARILKLNQSSISRIETGETDLKVKDLARLIKTFNLNAEYYRKLIFDSIDDE